MRHLVILLLIIVAFTNLAAQTPASGAGGASAGTDDAAPPPLVKRIQASHIVGSGPSVDGRLNDDVWRSATFNDQFLQKEPNEGATPTERTEVAFAYDDEALFVAAHCYCVHPEGIQALVTRRDNAGSAERFIVTLDTYHDRRTAYSFCVTAAGVRTDYYHRDDNEFSREYSFDPVWEARVANDSTGWTAEMRIPFSQLRFNDQPEQVWGLNMDRYIPTKDEDIYWIPIPHAVPGWSSHFGEIVGIHGIKPALRLELMPYAAAGARFTGDRDPNNPFDDGRNLHGRAGVDLKMGVGPNLTLDATVNPDFGQVEADPATVNLSAYETFFDERRPFFVEGNGIFTSPVSYFYSRRIGAPPHGTADGDFVDMPGNTSILGAAKISGRLASGTSIAGLAAVTGREYARTYAGASDSYSDVEVEPPTGYLVARVVQETDSIGSVVGGTVTVTRRDMKEGGALAQTLARDAITGGLDLSHHFDDDNYQFDGWLGGSFVAGDTSAIALVQQSSAHYFQRPDATHLRFDPTRTSLSGMTAGVALARRRGEHWRWSADVYAETPGLELNNVGRLSSADDIGFDGELSYRETTPGEMLHDYSFALHTNGTYNFQGTSPGTSFSLNANATLLNFWGGSFYADYGTAGQADDWTRGGPLMGVPWNVDAGFSLWTGYGTPTRANLNFNAGRNGAGNWYYNVNAWCATNLGDQIELSLSPSFSRFTDARQYVDAIPGGRSETYGTRYVFSWIDRATLSTQFRASYAITPDLSVEAYAEPFAASGHYYRFGELPAPRSHEIRTYGEDGTQITPNADGSFLVQDGAAAFTIPSQDFRYISFRSNLVLRWEWRAGSALYLVWQQDRSRVDASRDLATPRDLFNSFTTTGDNFLTLKITYWFAPG